VQRVLVRLKTGPRRREVAVPVRIAQHRSATALILIDVINHFEFPDGERLRRQALRIGPALVRLKARARKAGIPTVYVNDNFGQWRSERARLLAYCTTAGARARSFVEPLYPDASDYFVLKPMHSAFYQTPLETLLEHLGATTLILTGLATNSCIMCTAHDADMREYGIIVPPDCCAARTRVEHRRAIEHIGSMTAARVTESTALRLSR
jgi:nicotinamidase-related amidase